MPRKVFQIDPGVWTVGAFHNGELIGGCKKKYKSKKGADKELKRLNAQYGR